MKRGFLLPQTPTRPGKSGSEASPSPAKTVRIDGDKLRIGKDSNMTVKHLGGENPDDRILHIRPNDNGCFNVKIENGKVICYQPEPSGNSSGSKA